VALVDAINSLMLGTWLLIAIACLIFIFHRNCITAICFFLVLGRQETSEKNHGYVSGLAALKVATLRRHYYPEGSWGWIIVIVSVIINILNHGLQLSSPLFLLPAGKRFHEGVINSSGEFNGSAFLFLYFEWKKTILKYGEL
jgi:hypothetical protein